INAVRTGGVTLANAVGNGVADDKLLYTYVPDLIRYYLHDEPILNNVDTWRLEEDAAREEVLDRLNELVVKPVDGSGGKGIVIGPRATAKELDALRRRITTDPRGWIAQPVVQLSTVPTLIEDDLRPRHVDLRPFAVNSGDEVWVLPGGLTRVALPEGELVVNSSQGGGSKDTWVLSPSGDQASADEPGEGPDDVPSPAHAPVEDADEIDDHGPPHTPSPAPPAEEEEVVQEPDRPAPPPPTRVPLTVSALPMAVLPRREPTPRQQEEQQQQGSIARSARADPALSPTAQDPGSIARSAPAGTPC
ncbi:MAG TPA: circularly permuted type 2 ATP-grasp protein, partial [Propionibacteriaceae bacterium]|nr:circularly permuted type 2 ATP-grasp protein [Propionibacteriaceae bacterium]